MSPKAEDPYKPKFKGQASRPNDFNRGVLEPYIQHPEKFPPDQVIDYNDDFVVINDAYPKSSIHCLVLSRNSIKNTIHPINALDDPNFLAQVRSEVEKTKVMIARELRRRHGRVSTTDKPRVEAMEKDDLPEILPAGRDWTKDIMCGFHAQPSMSHLHVHVLPVDMAGTSLKKRSQYISFKPPYLISLEEFPLAADDPRRDPDTTMFEPVFEGDLICWRCEANYGRKFAKFKEHLTHEFEEWRRE